MLKKVPESYQWKTLQMRLEAIVKSTLEKVPGVSGVKVSFENKTAVVTFGDSRTDTMALTVATKQMGYASILVPKGG